MFIAVVSGYIMAAVMAFCGIYSIVHFFQGDLENLGATGFVYGIAVAAWPLVVAVALFALIQAIILLEKLVIFTTMNQMAAVQPASPAVAKGQAPQKHAERPQVTRSFFHIEPGSVPPPPAEGPAPETMELDSIAELAHRTDSERILTETAPAPAEAADGTDAAPQEPAPVKRPGDGLSFFRVD